MLQTHVYPEYAYQLSDEQRSGVAQRHPVVIVGAGPIGLTAALDLARRGVRSVVIDDNNTVSIGSRAVCYAKRPLEIWDRLGVAQGLVDRGVSWQVGRVFFRNDPVYRFDLLPEPHHRMPAMINLQQYYLEEALVDACAAQPLIELRWKHQLMGLVQKPDHAVLKVRTADGAFEMHADWVIACDGANSDTRQMVGAGFSGQFFEDRFLIADVVMKADFPTERWFWFDPPFHRGQSVLLHKQCDDVWRIDFQLGWDADPNEEKKPEKVIPRIQAMLGPEHAFELEWVSVYQFACRRIDRFRYGRVLFAGDAAHQVSPFGARGANTGIQDTDNLAWKLALVISGDAPLSLIDSYHDERAFAADDNLLNSTRSTDFITPKSRASLRFRDAVLELAEHHAFARPLVNSGRLSTPTPYVDSPLNTTDSDDFSSAMRPGTNAADAPVKVDGVDSWLLAHLGDGFTVLVFGQPPAADALEALAALPAALQPRVLTIAKAGGDAVFAEVVADAVADLDDALGVMAGRYDARDGAVYLIRPDQHVAARWRRFDVAAIVAAVRRATGHAAVPTVNA